MIPLDRLYRLARKENIPVDHRRLFSRQALSLMDADGDCFICIDRRQVTGDADHRTKLAHELGHCLTGSFYNQYSPYDLRQKHENQADRWGIRLLIPPQELTAALEAGAKEPWELAERFGVTEDFMKKALCLYKNGNLAADQYF